MIIFIESLSNLCWLKKIFKETELNIKILEVFDQSLKTNIFGKLRFRLDFYIIFLSIILIIDL